MKRYIFLLMVLFFASCDKKDSGNSLASVGNAQLAEDFVLRAVESGEGSVSDIVNQWIEEEILFQNALSSGFLVDTPFLSNLEKKLAGQMFLQRLAGEKIVVSNADINEYYEKNKFGFIRKNKSARVYHLLFPSKEESKKAVNVLKSNKKDEEKNQLINRHKAQPVVVIDGGLIKELNNPLFSSRYKKRVIGPIKSAHGYHVLFVLERFKENSFIPLEELYDEIYQRIYQQKFALKSLRILDSLRNHTPYEINL
ncbi:MAG: peptidyl-prolyl cis-trans isomerase [Fidelibacterota bacterium]